MLLHRLIDPATDPRICGGILQRVIGQIRALPVRELGAL